MSCKEYAARYKKTEKSNKWSNTLWHLERTALRCFYLFVFCIDFSNRIMNDDHARRLMFYYSVPTNTWHKHVQNILKTKVMIVGNISVLQYQLLLFRQHASHSQHQRCYSSYGVLQKRGILFWQRKERQLSSGLQRIQHFSEPPGKCRSRFQSIQSSSSSSGHRRKGFPDDLVSPANRALKVARSKFTLNICASARSMFHKESRTR